MLVTIACSGPQPDPAPAPNPSPAPAPDSAPAPAPPASQTLATAEGRTPGLRAEVTELKRTSGGTLTLRFTLVNDSRQTVNVGDVQALLDLGGSYPVGGVHLIDAAGRKKYFVARDSENRCVCSEFTGLAPGERANHWAKFPAPPDEVQQISVVLPTFSPMDDVPIGR
ncbi:MAG TPA: hypothetical protein VFZ36_04315 [Vicinamibacterales bacterium]